MGDTWMGEVSAAEEEKTGVLKCKWTLLHAGEIMRSMGRAEDDPPTSNSPFFPSARRNACSIISQKDLILFGGSLRNGEICAAEEVWVRSMSSLFGFDVGC